MMKVTEVEVTPRPREPNPNPIRDALQTPASSVSSTMRVATRLRCVL